MTGTLALVGGGEFGYGKLYALLGRPAALGVLASLAQRLLTWVLGLAGYLLYLRMKPAQTGAQPEVREPVRAGVIESP